MRLIYFYHTSISVSMHLLLCAHNRLNPLTLWTFSGGGRVNLSMFLCHHIQQSEHKHWLTSDQNRGQRHIHCILWYYLLFHANFRTAFRSYLIIRINESVAVGIFILEMTWIDLLTAVWTNNAHPCTAHIHTKIRWFVCTQNDISGLTTPENT